MSLPASTCLRGANYLISVNAVTECSPEQVDSLDNSLKCRDWHRDGTNMSQSDPSEFELHRKARSLGLLLRQEGSIVSGLNFQVSPLTTKIPGHAGENRDIKLTRQTLPGIGSQIGGDGAGTHRNQQLTKSVALPKIPIRHPFEKRPPNITQQEGKEVVDTPLSLTTLLMTPRSKTTLNPSSFTGKKLKSTGNRWSTHSETFRNADPHPSTTRLVISPKSKADLYRSPGDFYQRKFPHVHLDHSLINHHPRKHQTQTGNKLSGNPDAFTDSIHTTSQLFSLTRSKTDLMAVEQLIHRTQERAKSSRTWAVAGWLDGMTCNPKKLHSRRDLEYFVK